MLFSADEIGIDLRIAQTDKGFTVSGQILGADSGAQAIKLASEEKSFDARTSELGEFKFENVSKGSYALTLTVQDKEIIIENIEID
jgi:hypothetical protein